MAGKNTAAFGIYHDEATLKNGISELERNGFRVTDISVLYPENVGMKDFVMKKQQSPGRRRAPEEGTGAVAAACLVGLQASELIAIPGVAYLS